MLRATEILRAGLWGGAPVDTVRLDYDRRTRRRIALMGRGGLSFLLDLAKAPVLVTGDGIRLEDGRIVAVEAATERLLEIVCRDERALARIAWHLGNRHLATELGDRTIYIREDYVIAEMVKGLGATVRSVERAFNPEGGAYGHGAVHGHTHSHTHEHGHTHDHQHHHDAGHHHGTHGAGHGDHRQRQPHHQHHRDAEHERDHGHEHRDHDHDHHRRGGEQP